MEENRRKIKHNHSLGGISLVDTQEKLNIKKTFI